MVPGAFVIALSDFSWSGYRRLHGYRSCGRQRRFTVRHLGGQYDGDRVVQRNGTEIRRRGHAVVTQIGVDPLVDLEVAASGTPDADKLADCHPMSRAGLRRLLRRGEKLILPGFKARISLVRDLPHGLPDQSQAKTVKQLTASRRAPGVPAIHAPAAKLPDRSGRASDLTAIRQLKLPGLRHGDLEGFPRLRPLIHQDRARFQQAGFDKITDSHAPTAK